MDFRTLFRPATGLFIHCAQIAGFFARRPPQGPKAPRAMAQALGRDYKFTELLLAIFDTILSIKSNTAHVEKALRDVPK